MKKTALAAIVFLASFGVSQAAPHHPRRAQVNTRLARQNYRIDKKVEDGKMSEKEAAKLHTEDHQIRQEEKDMASQDGGHITKQEQKTLNQQENQVSKGIKNH
jgi:Skp family chaperone for outer membrane proteins